MTTRPKTRPRKAVKRVKRRAAKRFPLNNILVPTDFSPASRRVAENAAALSKSLGGRVNLIHVEPSAWPADLESVPLMVKLRDYRQAALESLQRFEKEAVPPRHRGQVSIEVGTPYQEIAKRAKKLKTDLIVLSTHGYTGLKHLLLGSTAESVVRHAHCPVLTIRPAARRGARKALPLRTILVTTDFSKTSNRTIKYACELARHVKAKLTLLHVVELPQYPRYGYAQIPIEDAQLRKSALHEMAKVKRKHPGVKTTKIRTGEPHEEIIAEAKASGSDLVIVGSHGQPGLARAILGSTAERVVRHANGPVLVARNV